ITNLFPLKETHMAEELETKNTTLMPYGEISQKIAAYNTPWGSRQINQPEKILTTNLPSYIPIAFPLKPGSPIDELLADLRDLVKEDEKDEYGIFRPTMHALSLTILLIIEAYCRQHSNWPFGCVSTDSEGGIRIEWHSSKGEI